MEHGVLISLFLLYLKRKVSERASVLDDTLGQVSSLRDRLDGFLEQLLKMKAGLKGHQPPHVIPAGVEKQIKALMVCAAAVVGVGVYCCCCCCCCLATR